jgi:hypothetical protein
MEHTQALEMNAPDRYVLGMLSAAEADAFEEHYFDCSACAEDVRLGMSIMEGGRLLVQQGAEPPAPAMPVAPVVPIDSRGKWGRWIPAAAVAAVMAIPVNFALLMRMQNVAPRVAATVAAAELYIPLPDDRAENGGAPETLLLAAGEDGVLIFDVPDGPSYTRCEARILRGQELVETILIRPDLVKRRLSITFHDPGPGTYDVVILGFDTAGQESEINRGTVNVKRLNSGS